MHTQTPARQRDITVIRALPDRRGSVTARLMIDGNVYELRGTGLGQTFRLRTILSVTTNNRRINLDGACPAKRLISFMTGKAYETYQGLGGGFFEDQALCVEWLLRQYPALPTTSPSDGESLQIWCNQQDSRLRKSLLILPLTLRGDEEIATILPLG